MFSLKNKTAVITGGGSGIGRRLTSFVPHREVRERRPESSHH